MADGTGAAETLERGRKKSRRAVGCLSLLLIVAALPMAAVGLLLYDNSESTHTGVGGGLSGLGSATGWLLMIAAGILLVVGGASYILSAPKNE